MSSFDLKSLVRPNIYSLEPYRCARDDYEEGVLLDANENSHGSAVKFPFVEELERYPSPYQVLLKEKIAKHRGVHPANIFLGVGSDEAIDIVIRVFCAPAKEAILTLPPTYGMYKVSAATNDVRVVTVPLTPDFQIDMDPLRQAIKENQEIKLIFICSPNNPTANDLKRDDIITVLTENPAKIVVVDEAYIDFSEQPSFGPLVEEYPNLIVLQTLSKAFGLAGIRLGMAFAQKGIIDIMNKVKAPYNIGKLTSQAGLETFKEESLEIVRSNIEKIKQEKKRLLEELAKFPTVRKVYPSDANFIIFRIDDAFSLYKKVADLGVVVRYRGMEIHCNDCLRMTIGTKDENDRFLTLLRQVTGSS